MAFTENYAILNDFPLFWEPECLQHNVHLPRLHRDMPSRFAVIPRRGDTSQIQWFEADPTYVLHFTNAYEDGDEIVLDGFFQGDPEPADDGIGDKWQRAFRFLAMDRMQTRLHRWRFNLVTGAAREEQLSDSITEFGMINSGHAGRDYRYTYAATGKPGWFLFDGLVKHDLVTGAEERFAFDDGVYGSETARWRPGVGQHRRGRRLPGHHHHRHERRRLLLPGVRRGAGGRRSGVQTGSARTGFERNPLDVGTRLGAAALAPDRRRRRGDRSVVDRVRAESTPSAGCSACSATSGRC